MSRPAFPILILSALLVSVAAHSAEARTKSFCRRWAAGVASNNVAYETQARAAEKGATNLSAPAPQDRAKVRALAGGGLGGSLHRMTRPGRWHEIYNKAYAHCRVVQN